MDKAALEDFNRCEPGWELVGKFPRLAQAPKFVSGVEDVDRIRINFFRDSNTGRIVGKVWFGPNCDGPPGHAHGGSVAAALDEVMGGVGWMNGHTVLAANISINFRRMVPTSAVYWFEGWIERKEGKKVYTAARIHRPGEPDFSDSTGLFIVIDASRFLAPGDSDASS